MRRSNAPSRRQHFHEQGNKAQVVSSAKPLSLQGPGDEQAQLLFHERPGHGCSQGASELGLKQPTRLGVLRPLHNSNRAKKRSAAPCPPIHASGMQGLQEGSTATEVVYKVLYTKRASKKQRKNKLFMDGTLVVPPSGLCRLLDDQGGIIARRSNWGAAVQGLAPGAEAEVGPWEVEIDERLGHDLEGPSTAIAEHPKVQQHLAGLPATGPKRCRRPAPASFADGDQQAPLDALVLNEIELIGPSGAASSHRMAQPVTVHRFLSQTLRTHQREGVRFLYECVMGLRQADMYGCILADDMGLGKTLQVISLLWTLLSKGPQGNPVVRKACIVTPSSLVYNWASEFKKWLGDARLRPLVVPPGPESIQLARDFKLGQSIHRVMITSYETLRKIAPELKSGCCDIVVCDEGHRLKAAGGSKTIDALENLQCSRRILLTGTPIQNSLDEFFAMISFVNPGLLGPLQSFKRVYSAPIQRSRDRGALSCDKVLGKERSEELSKLVAPFVLRRTSDIIAKHLPPLTIYLVFVRPTSTQLTLYQEILSTTSLRDAVECAEAGPDVLSAITKLRKICNHPYLLTSPEDKKKHSVTHSSLVSNDAESASEESGKMAVLRSLLVTLCVAVDFSNHPSTCERMVIVCSSTQALDIIGALCSELGLTAVRIDGRTDPNRRQEIVDGFNKYGIGQVCLLSTRAGGAGLNLTGASRLVLFDSDWNPAVDQQAMARIHRDGQKKPCIIYRLLTTGTIDEKIFQRQLRKVELADAMGGQESMPKFTSQELQQIFTINTETLCETADLLSASAIPACPFAQRAGLCCPDEAAWRNEINSVQDSALRSAVSATKRVTFVCSGSATKTRPTDENENSAEHIESGAALPLERSLYEPMTSSVIGSNLERPPGGDGDNSSTAGKKEMGSTTLSWKRARASVLLSSDDDEACTDSQLLPNPQDQHLHSIASAGMHQKRDVGAAKPICYDGIDELELDLVSNLSECES